MTGTTRSEIIAMLPSIVDEPTKYFQYWHEALGLLVMFCKTANISMDFRYNSGWFQVPTGKNESGNTEYGEPTFDADSEGYTMAIGGSFYAREEDGGEIYYQLPAHAAHAGFKLLLDVLTEG